MWQRIGLRMAAARLITASYGRDDGARVVRFNFRGNSSKACKVCTVCKDHSVQGPQCAKDHGVQEQLEKMMNALPH